MEQIHELLGYKRIKIIQNKEMFSFSLDSILLANFVSINKKVKRIIDLGCGNGPIPLFLTLKTNAEIIGVEIQKQVADMAQRSVALNSFDSQIKIINADMKNIYKYEDFVNSFNIVISNPPYFKAYEKSNFNKNDFLTIARHEIKITLSEIINEAKKLLVDGGSLFLIHRVERLDEVLEKLKSENFNVKAMQFIYPKKGKDGLLVMFNAKKNGNPGLKVLEPIYVYNEDGQYSDSVRKIFNFNA